MDFLLFGLLCGALGLALGIGGLLAYRASEASRSTADLQSDDELPEGIAEVLAVLSSAAIVVDAGDDVIKASPAAYTLGLVRGNVLASDLLLDTVARVRTRGLIEEVDFEVKRDGGAPRYLHARVAPLGQAYGLVLADDQTESRRVDEMRRDFVANVSHELKTPIGAMALLAEAVTDYSDDPEAVQRFGTKIQKESSRLTQLVKEIIDLSRVQDHLEFGDASRVSVVDAIDDAVDRARTHATDKGIEIVVDAGGHGEEVEVDGNFDMLVNALRNLVDNAINYSNDGTRVGVGLTTTTGHVHIAVTDQGIGLSEDDRERVFERFYRVDPARSRNTGGTGLGLSIVKHIIATMGGEVRIWSELSVGSTFTIVLPRAAGANPPDADLDRARRGGILLEPRTAASTDTDTTAPATTSSHEQTKKEAQ